MRVSAGLDAGRVGLALVVPALALTSSGGLSIMPVEVTQMSTPDEQPIDPRSDRLDLTWLGRFRAIQGMEATSIWLKVALETVLDRDPEDAKNDAEMLWRLCAIRADDVMADAIQALEDIGL